jgi:hypothetical protein
VRSAVRPKLGLVPLLPFPAQPVAQADAPPARRLASTLGVMSRSVIPMNSLQRSLLSDLVAVTVQGDAEQVRRLLSLGVRPDAIDKSSGWSALHASVLHNPSLLPTLLKFTETPDSPLVMGGTPLSYVVHELGENPDPDRRQSLFEAIGLLMHAGANPQCGGSDQTALELARLYKMPEVEALLLKGIGGDCNAT